MNIKKFGSIPASATKENQRLSRLRAALLLEANAADYLTPHQARRSPYASFPGFWKVGFYPLKQAVQGFDFQAEAQEKREEIPPQYRQESYEPEAPKESKMSGAFNRAGFGGNVDFNNEGGPALTGLMKLSVGILYRRQKQQDLAQKLLTM